ncbi:hypothetical protein PL11201_580033 [Planktothrix sp. PCC 11201]|uniref:hypothetical protein n=1 Tax=Planktothrix sp. PCC 11201 TaxID=1729650 RepID=UPI00091707CD|nr:hypothetical protein [Planktothrix sp. PCC 11201]SKB14041.1 hypothetical protein PL11201_580033 [Planktothrix sp. PCC 11201]
MTLTELKAKATELGLTPDEVRQHGSLSRKATWEIAIAEFEEMKVAVDAHCEAMGITQWSYPEDETEGFEPSEDITVTPIPPTVEDLPFDNPTHTLIDGEWVLCSEIVDPSRLPTLKETDPRFEAWQPWMMPGATFTSGRQTYEILYFDVWGNCMAKGIDTRWHSFRIETIVNTATDDFVQKSQPIPPITPAGEASQLSDCLESPTPIRDQLLLKMMDKGLSLPDLEQLQNEPLDEDTAAVYLGWLEAGQEILAGALAV